MKNANLLNESPLLVLPSLAVAVGLEGSILLQQLHYWTLKAQPRDDGRQWVYNTLKQWAEKFPFWSERTIRRIISDMRNKGIIDVQEFNAYRGDRTSFYAINHEALAALFGAQTPSDETGKPCGQIGQTMRPNGPDHAANLATSIKEQRLHTENTTERKAGDVSPSPENLNLEPQNPQGRKGARKAKPAELTFDAWLETIPGDTVIVDDDPIWPWLKAAGIPEDWHDLAWDAFCDKYTGRAKTYADWRAAFRDHVKRGWLDVWRAYDGRYVLTTQGEQLRRVRDGQGAAA